MNFYSIEQSFLFLFLNAQQVVNNFNLNSGPVFQGYYTIYFRTKQSG